MANNAGEWTPARPGTKPLTPRRTIKLQVCLSADERARLDERARSAGFETIASYVRSRTVPASGTATPGVGAGSASKGQDQ